MAKYRLKKLQLTANNSHLTNLLNLDYFIELGNVDLNMFWMLFSGKKIDLDNIINKDIVNNGIGKLSNHENDYKMQLDYLQRIIYTNSMYNIMLTAGVVRYIDNKGLEKFAPIVLIPISINNHDNSIIEIAQPIINSLLVNDLIELKYIPENKLNSFKEIFNHGVESIYDIDQITLAFQDLSGVCASTESYFTFAELTYGKDTDYASLFDVPVQLDESDIKDFFKNYFQTFKAITPLNMYQKNACYQAHNGLSFAVDGKFASGKTLTALNIIADAVFNNKKVLYVNNDIYKLRKFNDLITHYGLSRFTKILVDSIQDSKVSIIEQPKRNELPELKLDSIINIDEVYENKINGFTLREIISNLIIYNNSNVSSPFSDLPELDHNEVKQVYKSLKETSLLLSKIDYNTSLWNNLNPDSVTSVEDVKFALERFVKCNNQIIEQLDIYSKDIGIKNIQNSILLNRYIYILNSFSKIRPNKYWKNLSKDHFNDLYNKIKTVIKSYQKIKQVEEEKIKKTYSLESLVSDYKVITNIIKDNECIDNILSNRDLLKQLLTEIKLFNNLDEKLSFFKGRTIDELISEEDINFYTKLNTFLSKNNINLDEIRNYVKFKEKYFNCALIFDEAYKKYYRLIHELQATYPKFNIKYETLYKCNSTYDFNRIAFSYIQDKDKIDEFIEVLRQIKKSGEIVCSIYNIYYSKAEQNWDIYKIFTDLVLSLNNNEFTIFKSFYDEGVFKNQETITDLLNRSTSLIEIYNNVNTTIRLFRRLGIKIHFTNLITTINDINSHSSDVELLNAVTSNIVYNVLDAERLSVKAIQSLINIYKEKTSLLLSLEDIKDECVKLFGSSYQGLNTDYASIHDAYICYDSFKQQFIYSDDDLSIFENEFKFNKLIEPRFIFEGLYNLWIYSLRTYSNNFKSPITYLQNQSFIDVKRILSNYEKELEKLYDTYNVSCNIALLRKFDLNQVVSYIYQDVNKDNLADEFLHSYFIKLAKTIKMPKASNSKHTWNGKAGLFFYYEKLLCENNLHDLFEIKQKNSFLISDLDMLSTKYFESLTEQDMDTTKNIYLTSAKEFGSLQFIKFFDLVIVDNGELSTAQTYREIEKAKQVIVFGDSTFKLTIENGLLQRIGRNKRLNLPYRYIVLNEANIRTYTQKNQFSINYKSIELFRKVNSIEAMVKDVVDSTLYGSKKICFYVSNENSRRKIVRTLLDLASDEFSYQCYLEKYKIVNPLEESQYYCDEGYIFYNDIKDFDPKQKELFYLNVLTKDNVTVFCPNDSNYDNFIDLTEYNKSINLEKNLVLSFLAKGLQNDSCRIRKGIGIYELLIFSSTKNIAVNIYGLRSEYSPFYIDEHEYSKYCYELMGYEILEFSLFELYADLNKVVYQIRSRLED